MSDDNLIPDLIAKITAAIDHHAHELSELDRAIGDGDHGLNMRRGFKAVAETAPELEALGFGEALQKAGMTLVMKVGGASGPLYGSALMAMGKHADGPPSSSTDAAALLEAGIEAIKKRGKSDAGAKTMLDVLIPVHQAVVAGADVPSVREAAASALEATGPMRATKGRAAFLGERSIGHVDPGARSSALIIAAVCDVLEKK